MNMPVRILLVDDHPLVRDGLKARLQVVEHLHVVGEAGHGAEALELASRVQADLALVDISMPDMNGIELTRRLRESSPDLHVLILSMYDNGEYVSSALKAGARGYLLKDAPASEVLRAIETVAEGGSYFCQSAVAAMAEAPAENTPLTDREREILIFIVKGESNKRIAQQLNISVRTVETHRMSLRRKLGVITSAGLVHYALKQGWIDSASNPG